VTNAYLVIEVYSSDLNLVPVRPGLSLSLACVVGDVLGIDAGVSESMLCNTVLRLRPEAESERVSPRSTASARKSEYKGGKARISFNNSVQTVHYKAARSDIPQHLTFNLSQFPPPAF